ncbi:glycine betaine/proline transport system substrate-binding protein [Streptomyces sp. TLI_55]|uniref:ABC transporter permease/substrate binding protein n=1 Tax=Streptomyces sp. TLI_55 TaxID=1938861 RepID=UPI000BDB0643|nr:ABC transporter permease/substrate binding protein [Streptomyces sp. TLI_55]SNX57178.1 glycine betaine/proline transport system substrate-binding protein [Streptomyces sp. TLI_55]
MPRIPLGDWVNDAVDWLLAHMGWLFDFLKTVFTSTYDGIDAVLQAPAPLLLAGIFAVLAFWLRGTLAGVLTFAGFAFIDSLELWDDAMVTLSLVLVATLIALVVSVPVGIWAARSERVGALVRPVLDFMQTLPAMIYLIPAILFFGTGASAGIVATLIFALAPGVRMTELGIRQVDKELVEAAEAFGTTPKDTLLRVQLPLALPTVMAGVNQVIMLGLSMAAIAGMVGTGGLGGRVNEAIGQLDVGLGSEAGVAIVILAIYLDRMTGALGTQVSPLGRRAAAKARAAQGLKIWSYRPRPQVAVVGIVILALVAGGMGIFGGKSDSAVPVADAKNVGQGEKVRIGYVPWDDGVASTFLWKEILEERGFQVEAKQLDAGPLYTSVASGNVDFMTGAWLPTTHEQYWKKYGDRLDDLGAWYDKTSLELSVPSYMKGVDSLDDLKGKASEFDGKITGIESSAGEMALLKSKVLGAYGLDKDYKVVDSSTPAMLAELKRAYSKKEPIVVTLWSPHWAYNDYDLKKLKDPKGAWGSGDGIHTVARKGFAAKNPVVGKWLKDFKLDEKQLTSLEAEINKAGKGEQQDAVRSWLKSNPGVVDKLAPVAKSAAAPAEAKNPIDVAWFPWDEDIAVTHLWKNVLERRGYKLNLKQMDVGPVYTGLASGDLDLNFDAWLPYAQANYWQKSKDRLADLGTWYEPTSLEVAVPSYVKGIKTYEDLKGKADLFGGKIIGIEPGTGEMNLLKNKVLPGYGLDKEYDVVDGSTPAMLTELKRAYAEKKPVAVVLWSPHWAYSQYHLTKLTDGKKLFGEGNTIRTIANEKFPEQYPRLTKWIKGFHLSEGELGTLEGEINAHGQGHEDEAVDAWLKKHPDVVERMTPR